MELKQIKGITSHLNNHIVKLICTRKAPNGRRKVRIVACGNYSQAVSFSDTSSGGIDAVSLRTLLAAGSQRQCSIGSLDVKSVAPFRSASSRCALIKPPQLAVTGAHYGLAESPGDWTDYRDQQLRAMEHQGQLWLMWLQQAAESKLWRIMLDDSSQGSLGTYVDDFLVSGSAWIVEQTLAKIASIWECSSPEVLDSWMLKNSRLENIHLNTIKCGADLGQDRFNMGVFKPRGLGFLDVEKFKAGKHPPEHYKELRFLRLRDSHGLQWIDLASEVLHPGADEKAQRQQNLVFELFCSLNGRCSG